MHLQENTLFDLDLWVKVTGNDVLCPLHHVTYAATEFEVTTSNSLEAFTRKFKLTLILLHPMVKERMHLQENTLFDLDLWVKVAGNVGQYPLHHVTYPARKFEVAMTNRLIGDTFTRKYII